MPAAVGMLAAQSGLHLPGAIHAGGGRLLGSVLKEKPEQRELGAQSLAWFCSLPGFLDFILFSFLGLDHLSF